MKANLARGWILGCLVACLGATTASCSDDDDPPPPLTDLERGTMAATRQDACGLEDWLTEPFTVNSQLGVLLSVFPGHTKRGVDCILAAHDCREVDACTLFFVADEEQRYEDLNLPECGSERTDHCEGNVAKYCVSDDQKTWYQASYDCTLAGATCIEGQAESGEPWADCQAPQLHCEGPSMSYCDGTRAVACEETFRGVFSPWVYDCADAFGSHCIDHGIEVECEGPATGEQLCDDGIDGDGDGKVDCDDDDCEGDCP